MSTGFQVNDSTAAFYFPYNQEMMNNLQQEIQEGEKTEPEVQVSPMSTFQNEDTNEKTVSPSLTATETSEKRVKQPDLVLPPITPQNDATNSGETEQEDKQDETEGSEKDPFFGLSAAFSEGQSPEDATNQASALSEAAKMAENGSFANNGQHQAVVWLPVPITTNGQGFSQYMAGMPPGAIQMSPGMGFQMPEGATMDGILGAVRRLTEANDMNSISSRKRKRKNRLCAEKGCSKNARGRTQYCVRHGGGSRCSVEGCEKGARPHSQFCSGHGGGHRCLFTGCKKGALAKSVYCRRHGKTASSNSNVGSV